VKQRWNPDAPRSAGTRPIRWRKVSPLAATSILLFTIQMRAAGPQSTDAQQLAREVIQNEVQAEANNHNLWNYRMLTRSNGKELLFECRDTKDGTIQRLVAVNGHPLNPRERQVEDSRIQKLIRSQEALREAQKKENADAQQEGNFLKLFPEVFLYQEEDRHDDLTKLRFISNPRYHPGGNMARVLHSLQGTMVVDVRQKRLVSINGRLTTDVKFWGGLIGYLNSGGTFSVSMQNVAPGDWELKSLNVDMRGKALLFKTIGVQQHKAYSNYTHVSTNTDSAQAAGGGQKDSSY
jgi:hypothetical protein